MSDTSLLTPVPFRRNSTMNTMRHPSGMHRMSPVQRNARDDDFDDEDPFPFDMNRSWQEIDQIDSYWNEPLLRNILKKPSHDETVVVLDSEINTTQPTGSPSSKSSRSVLPSTATATSASSLSSFSSRLENVHESIRDLILAQPAEKQGALVGQLRDWARDITQDPLLTNAHDEDNGALFPGDAHDEDVNLLESSSSSGKPTKGSATQEV
jgi:hypothetical protein